MFNGPNPPSVVWGTCFLWHISIVAVCWSLLLFFCVSDLLTITGTDVLVAVLLLSGILMLPTNSRILWDIANGNKIDYRAKVLCCPLWLSIVGIIVVSCVGLILCTQKIIVSDNFAVDRLNHTIRHYRTVPKYKHFVDNLQWSLKCCGLYSYRDWFDQDWHDKIRNFEWDPSKKNRRADSFTTIQPLTDSVPLSCCKSGSCISNYLQELGTHSINTRGCTEVACTIFVAFMFIHLLMFFMIIVVEIKLLQSIVVYTNTDSKPVSMSKNMSQPCSKSALNRITNIMSIKSNYNASSASFQLIPDNTISEELERVVRRSATTRHKSHTAIDMDRDFKKIDDEGPESSNEDHK